MEWARSTLVVPIVMGAARKRSDPPRRILPGAAFPYRGEVQRGYGRDTMLSSVRLAAAFLCLTACSQPAGRWQATAMDAPLQVTPPAPEPPDSASSHAQPESELDNRPVGRGATATACADHPPCPRGSVCVIGEDRKVDCAPVNDRLDGRHIPKRLDRLKSIDRPGPP